MKVETREQGEFEPVKIKEDIYHARFVDIKELGEKTYKDGNTAKTGMMLFQVFTDDKQSESVELGHYIPDLQASAGNKFGKALLALNSKIEFGKEFDTDSIIGTECRVLVENFEKDSNGEKVKVSGISKVKPSVTEEEEVKD